MKMKPAMILVVVLVGFVSPRIARCECVFVPPTFQPASQSVRIAALLDGKPMSDAHFDIFLYPHRYGDQPRYSLISNEKGVAAIRKITPANYEIAVSAKWGWMGDLLVAVSRGEELSELSVNLLPDREHAFVETILGAAEKRPVTTLFPEFTGAMRDPSGAGISGTKITVWSVGEEHAGPGTEGTADNGGRFSISLPEGRYVALFEEPGFGLKAVLFGISKAASPGDVKVTLEVGWC